jgi:hypothetical protein
MVTIMITVFIYVTPYSLVDRYIHFRGICRLHLQSKIISRTLKIKATVFFSGTLIRTYETLWCHIPDEINLQSNLC